MANMIRVYYTGEGSRLEASPDKGRTWQTYTKCKVVDYGGTSYVWAPPGKTWEWKALAVKQGHLVHASNGKSMMQLNRSFPVVTGDDGPMDSYLDLSVKEAKVCFREADRDGLVLEQDYEKHLSKADLERRAAYYAAKAKELEPPAVSKKTKVAVAVE